MWLSNARFPTYKPAGCAIPHLYNEQNARQAHPSAGVKTMAGASSGLRLLLHSPQAQDVLHVFKNREEYVTETLCRPDKLPPAGPALQVAVRATTVQAVPGSKQASNTVMHATQLLVFQK